MVIVLSCPSFFTYKATAKDHIMAPILTDTVDLAGF